MSGEPRTGTDGKKRVVGYIRVSIKRQADEGVSLQAQEKRIRAFAESKGYELVKIYEDKGKSAYANVKRDGYDGMMDAIDSWDMCVAYHLNRFWRNSRKALNWIHDLTKAEKDFATIEGDINTSTSMGRFAVKMMMLVAELESEQISERVHASFDHKFQNDRFGWNTKPPYGYDLEGKGQPGKARLVINPSEAEGIRMAFKLIQKHSLLDVSLALNRAGHKTKRGNAFNDRAVMHIVHNPVYAGYCYRAKELRRNEHEHIISDDDFNAVQVVLIKRRRGRNPSTQAPLVVGESLIHAERVIANGGYYKPLEQPSNST
ncbi:MAG: recombinase family protein [Candidatus Thermoplasmatota archaeon]|nr:recombinase family protein [Candidatus Thermoplasmatota archaeon]